MSRATQIAMNFLKLIKVNQRCDNCLGRGLKDKEDVVIDTQT